MGLSQSLEAWSVTEPLYHILAMQTANPLCCRKAVLGARFGGASQRFIQHIEFLSPVVPNPVTVPLSSEDVQEDKWLEESDPEGFAL